MKVRANNVELYYELHGNGQPIVFSHGWLNDCSMWARQVQEFARTHAVVVYDHRGHGRSDKPRDSYSVGRLSEDLYALIGELDLSDVVLVGFSLGGMTALTLALDHPEKVSKLVLVGAAARMHFLARVLGAATHILPYRTVVWMASRFALHEPSPQMVKELESRAMRVPKYAAYGCLAALWRDYDVSSRVPQLQVPTWIIVGETDKLHVRTGQWLNGAIKRSELRIIPQAGHNVMIEQPEQFNRALHQVLGQAGPNT